MNRNQKIGIGCGAVGCLGLIVVAICVGLLLYLRSTKSPDRYSANRNYNFNINSSSNANNDNTNTNSDTTNTSEPDTSTSSTFSDDDKHKLFQAAGMAQDAELLTKTLKKIGLFKTDGTPAPGYEQFVKDHFSWAMNNTAFVNSINTPEKARAYVESHLED